MLLVELPYYHDSSCYYYALNDRPYAAWLDSQQQGRYDIIVADPHTILTCHDGHVTVTGHGQATEIDHSHNIFELIKHILPQKAADSGHFPFIGGALGFLSYDAGRLIEKLPDLVSERYILPEIYIGIYGWAVVVDHQDERAYLASHNVDHYTQSIWPQLIEILSIVKPKPVKPSQQHLNWSSNLNFDQYAERFEQIQRYITAGGCYQVNLAQRFSCDFSGDTLGLYRQLRQRAQAPYGAYIKLPQSAVLSFSPEQFLHLEYPTVVTKPIKGTRARGQTQQLDDELVQSLMTSQKDHAENVMIVDLLRNDLSRVCRPHSVKVPSLFALESYTNVHHLVSTVTGELHSSMTPVDLLKACFPGGSITGAPKCRVMEIIEALEPNRRSIYCGSILYIGYDWSMNSNICIRTILAESNQLFCWAGGGIIADSEVEAEYQETLDKVRHLRV